MKLIWIFKPAQGYQNTIAHALAAETQEHVGHINVVGYADRPGHPNAYADSFVYYATLKSDEDAGALGGEAGADTLAEAMAQLEHRVAHGDWPRGYWGGPCAG